MTLAFVRPGSEMGAAFVPPAEVASAVLTAGAPVPPPPSAAPALGRAGSVSHLSYSALGDYALDPNLEPHYATWASMASEGGGFLSVLADLAIESEAATVTANCL